MHVQDTFRVRLRSLRKGAGLRQEDLADKAGLTHDSISNYECGHTAPNVDVAARLAAALGVSVNDLIDPDPIEAAIRCLVDNPPPIDDERFAELRRVLAGA